MAKICQKTCGFVDCGKKYPMLLKKALDKMKKVHVNLHVKKIIC